MTETPVIVIDSSALVALLHGEDALHERATVVVRPLAGRLINYVLPAEVFAETLNMMGKKFGNATAIRQGKALLSDSHYYIQPSREEILEAALSKLVRQKASTSFVDALVMAWADHYQTKTIFGFDAAFAANGYELPG